MFSKRMAIIANLRSVLTAPVFSKIALIVICTSLLTVSNTVLAQHAISLSLDSGSAFPWEGSRPSANGTVNTGNGNKLTSIALVGWTAKGGMPVDISLYHNSEGSHNSELGQKWTWSYDIYLSVDSMTGDVTVHWGNDLSYTFTKSGSPVCQYKMRQLTISAA
ncbi:MAG: DUF6531 domain-containing protein [Chthonomonadales bacterium]